MNNDNYRKEGEKYLINKLDLYHRGLNRKKSNFQYRAWFLILWHCLTLPNKIHTEFSSQPRFRIQGGSLSVMAGRSTEILLFNIAHKFFKQLSNLREIDPTKVLNYLIFFNFIGTFWRKYIFFNMGNYLKFSLSPKTIKQFENILILNIFVGH